MKNFIIVFAALLAAVLCYDLLRFRLGFSFGLWQEREPAAFMTADAEAIYMDRGQGPEPFTIRGVNLGVGIPGKWAADYAIDKETYLRWFSQMRRWGANTVRVYITLQDDFYSAFYEYNTAREAAGEEPLWLIRGAWVNDYVQNAHRDAYHRDFLEAFVRDGRTMVDVIHGNRRISLGRGTGSGLYRRDISRWVLGYILGMEWEDVTVTYTDHKYPDLEPYRGTYLSASDDATAFESMLAQAGDRIIAYETSRYHQQRLVAFSNWPTTDPFLYPEDITIFLAYLRALRRRHAMPVVISEFGVSTGRGMAQRDQNTRRNQGHMSETEQGQALEECWEDIMTAGCVFTWQDEWFKRTWNTHARRGPAADALLERLSDQRAVFRPAVLRSRGGGERLLCGRRPFRMDGGG